VWTGAELIVWGGYNGSTYVATGGRYDPVSNAWANVSLVGAPSARYEHTAVWTGAEMIVWGGSNGNGSFLSTGARYLPLTDTWTATTSPTAPTGRYFHTAVWTGTEMIIWGGGTLIATDDGARYLP